MRIYLPIILVLLLGSTTAFAKNTCHRFRCIKQKKPGTHFIAELHTGGAFDGETGVALGGVLGVGGKLRGLPLRFYLIGDVSYGLLTSEGKISSTPLLYQESRSYTDLSLGLRTYVPIFRWVRLFVDITGGGSKSSYLLQRQGLTNIALDGWQGFAQFAGGLQLRLFHHLSLGLRSAFVLTDDPLANIRELTGQSSSLRSSFTAGITWHF